MSQSNTPYIGQCRACLGYGNRILLIQRLNIGIDNRVAVSVNKHIYTFQLAQ